MSLYNLRSAAEQDLREIASYTLNKWGTKQLAIYRQALNHSFDAIGKGEAINIPLSITLANILVTKCQHHYVFYISEGLEKPTIIGVIHEARDIVSLLASRFEE
jgi:toxin ParE1/3/4